MEATINNLKSCRVVSALEGDGNGARLYLRDADGGEVVVWVETVAAARELISCAQEAEQSLAEYGVEE